MGVMEKKKETTTMGLYRVRVWGAGILGLYEDNGNRRETTSWVL